MNVKIPVVPVVDRGLRLLGSKEVMSPARTDVDGKLEVSQVW